MKSIHLYKFMASLGTFLILTVSAQAFTQFGLVYDKIQSVKMDSLEGWQKDELKGEIVRVSNFLNNFDLRLKNGIRFGVDKPLEVVFEQFNDEKEMTLSCDPEDASSYSRLNDKEQIVLNILLKPLIKFQKMRDLDKGCSHYKALIASVEKSMLLVTGADDLDRKLKTSEVRTVNRCIDFDNPRKRLRKMSFAPKLKKKCAHYKQLRLKRRKYTDYENKWFGQMYRTKMEFDRTAIGNQTLDAYNICKRDYKPTTINPKNGKRIKMLAYAVVYMAPGHGTSVMGHIAERWIYCMEDKIQDKLFEYTQMTDKELPYFGRKFGDIIDNVSPEYVKSTVGKLFMKVKHNPGNTDLGHYGFFNLYSNRDIIEVFPKIEEHKMLEGLQWALNTVHKQKEDFKNEQPWPVYDLFKSNCTHPARKRLEEYSGDWAMNDWQGLTPINMFGFMRNKNAEKIIIYPSQRLLRKLRMLEKGESLFWENTTFWSKASKGKKGKGSAPILLYPETHGLLNKLLINPAYGVINLGAATVKTVIGIITMPFKWLFNLKFFRKAQKDDQGIAMVDGDGKVIKQRKKIDYTIAVGVRGMAFSLAEMLGVRMRYPAPTEWTKEEHEYIFHELNHHEPKVVDYLLEKVQQ